MALGIEKATIGVDQGMVQALKTAIHGEVIEEAVKAMDSGLTTLNNALDEIWHGASKNIFYDNMVADKEKITAALEQAYQVLERQITNAENAIGELDRTAVKPRS